MLKLHRVLLPVVAFAFVACGDEDPVEEGLAFEPKLSVIQQEVFVGSCNFGTCHSATRTEANLSLEGDAVHAALVGVSADNDAAAAANKIRVVAGDPDASFFVAKLRGELGAEEGTAMPQGTSGLEARKLEVIEEWIRLGAADD